MRLLFSVSVYCLIASCQSNKVRSMNLGDGTRAEGRIDADTTFDGVIKFYDATTNQLIEEGSYIKGIQNGSDIIYNKNGTIAWKANFADNQQNGYFYHFDSSGNLVQKGYSYYGLNVGGNITYIGDSAKEYYFYDLDEKLLMYIDYDSIKGKQFGSTHPILFFFHENHNQPYDSHGNVHSSRSYFVYTPNPPKFDFKYSFVAVDSSFKVLSVLNEIGNKQPWSIINIDWKPERPNQQLALRLKVRDSINSVDMIAFRVLKFW